jgi:predicted 2-oxoglutarate/Fe(II)-dependent dioxygenase YbiX
VVESVAGEDEIKLPAGHMVVYPSTAIHRVAPVTEGERLVAVGWAQSYIRDAGQRELLFELERAPWTFRASGQDARVRPLVEMRSQPVAAVGRDLN